MRSTPRALLTAAISVVAVLALALSAAGCGLDPNRSAPPSASSAASGVPPVDPVLSAMLPKSIDGRPTTGFTGSVDKVGQGDITIICAVFCPESGLYAQELGANPHTAAYGFAWVDGMPYGIAAIRVPNAPTDRLAQAWANARYLAAFRGSSPAITLPAGASATAGPTAPNLPPETLNVGARRLYVVGDGPPRFDLVYPYRDVLFVIALKARGDKNDLSGPVAASQDSRIQALVAALPH